MVISCAWIIWEAIQRILRNETQLHHSLWPVLVLLTSIAVDWWRSRKLRAVAERTGSPALATDAFHFASDIWATLRRSRRPGRQSWLGSAYRLPWLRHADPVAAIVVSVMIMRITFRLTQRNHRRADGQDFGRNADSRSFTKWSRCPECSRWSRHACGARALRISPT